MNEDSTNLVTVAILDDATEAALARNQLESAGIKVFLGQENASALGWAATGPEGGIRLQVAEADADAAWDYLESKPWLAPAEQEEIGFAASDDAMALARKKPAEQEDEDGRLSRREKLATRAFKAAVFGLIPPLFVFLLPYSAFLLLNVCSSKGKLEGRPRRHAQWTGLILGSLLLVPVVAILAAFLVPAGTVDLREMPRDRSLFGTWAGTMPTALGDMHIEMELAGDGGLRFRQTGAADLACTGDWAFMNQTLYVRLRHCTRGTDALQGKIGGWALEKYAVNEIWLREGKVVFRMARLNQAVRPG